MENSADRLGELDADHEDITGPLLASYLALNGGHSRRNQSGGGKGGGRNREGEHRAWIQGPGTSDTGSCRADVQRFPQFQKWLPLCVPGANKQWDLKIESDCQPCFILIGKNGDGLTIFLVHWYLGSSTANFGAIQVQLIQVLVSFMRNAISRLRCVIRDTIDFWPSQVCLNAIDFHDCAK